MEKFRKEDAEADAYWEWRDKVTSAFWDLQKEFDDPDSKMGKELLQQLDDLVAKEAGSVEAVDNLSEKKQQTLQEKVNDTIVNYMQSYIDQHAGADAPTAGARAVVKYEGSDIFNRKNTWSSTAKGFVLKFRGPVKVRPENPKAGFRFNPEAKLDTSRVHDTSDYDYNPDDHINHSYMTLSEMGNYLKHYGIKGMKWGVRRTDAQLEANNRGIRERITNFRKSHESIGKLKTGQVKIIETEDGPITVIKMPDGSYRKTRMSADAESALNTTRKSPSEMSTREMKEAVARMTQIEAYNKIFAYDSNRELRSRAEAMELQTRIKKAQAELNAKPSKLDTIGKAIGVGQKGFDLYKSVNDASGGRLNQSIKELIDGKSTSSTAKAAAKAAKAKSSKNAEKLEPLADTLKGAVEGMAKSATTVPKSQKNGSSVINNARKMFNVPAPVRKHRGDTVEYSPRFNQPKKHRRTD